jgi:hypothetical protein
MNNKGREAGHAKLLADPPGGASPKSMDIFW